MCRDWRDRVLGAIEERLPFILGPIVITTNKHFNRLLKNAFDLGEDSVRPSYPRRPAPRPRHLHIVS